MGSEERVSFVLFGCVGITMLCMESNLNVKHFESVNSIKAL